MPLNKSKGNMYPFVTHTWNTVKGKCPHGCSYCYMKKWGDQPELHFDESELKTDLGEGNFIFVGSSCDMWAENVLLSRIIDTLRHCHQYNNHYLFQSKNPSRIYYNKRRLPENSTIGTTIETNRSYPEMGKAPSVDERSEFMQFKKTMVTIEPIMDFDLHQLVNIVIAPVPLWVNIGADSGGHNLPEPSKDKVLDLIAELSKFTEVKLKKNLNRIIKPECKKVTTKMNYA